MAPSAPSLKSQRGLLALNKLASGVLCVLLIMHICIVDPVNHKILTYFTLFYSVVVSGLVLTSYAAAELRPGLLPILIVVAPWFLTLVACLPETWRGPPHFAAFLAISLMAGMASSRHSAFEEEHAEELREIDGERAAQKEAARRYAQEESILGDAKLPAGPSALHGGV